MPYFNAEHPSPREAFWSNLFFWAGLGIGLLSVLTFVVAFFVAPIVAVVSIAFVLIGGYGRGLPTTMTALIPALACLGFFALALLGGF